MGTASRFAFVVRCQWCTCLNGRFDGRFPSLPAPAGLSCVRQAIEFPEDRLRELCGLDATSYIRYSRDVVSAHPGVANYSLSLVHHCSRLDYFSNYISYSCGVFRTLCFAKIHDPSLYFLVETTRGLSLLWIHIRLLFWDTAILDWDPCLDLQWGFQAKNRQPRGCYKADCARVGWETSWSRRRLLRTPTSSIWFKDVPPRGRTYLRTPFAHHNCTQHTKFVKKWEGSPGVLRVLHVTCRIKSKNPPCGLLHLPNQASSANRSRSCSTAHLPLIKPLVREAIQVRERKATRRETRKNLDGYSIL